MCLPHGRYLSAIVICAVSCIPVPDGPLPMSTMTSPGLIGRSPLPFTALIASRSSANTRAGPICRYTLSASVTVASMAVALMTEPSGAMLPTGNTTVLVSPARRAASGDMITSSGETAAPEARRPRAASRRSLTSHQSSVLSSVSPVAVMTSPCSSPIRRRCSITSGTPPAMNTCTVGCPRGPFGSASTRRGVARFTRLQSDTVGRASPAACAMAGMCSSRFVDPPNAACTSIAFSMACGVRIDAIGMPSARNRISAVADRRPSSYQEGSPDGASALCGSARPSASATTCDVAAVPRN